jgi:hypothetical protein
MLRFNATLPILPTSLELTTVDLGRFSWESVMPLGGAPKREMVEAPSWRFKAAGCRFYTI